MMQLLFSFFFLLSVMQVFADPNILPTEADLHIYNQKPSVFVLTMDAEKNVYAHTSLKNMVTAFPKLRDYLEEVKGSPDKLLGAALHAKVLHPKPKGAAADQEPRQTDLYIAFTQKAADAVNRSDDRHLKDVLGMVRKRHPYDHIAFQACAGEIAHDGLHMPKKVAIAKDYLIPLVQEGLKTDDFSVILPLHTGHLGGLIYPGADIKNLGLIPPAFALTRWESWQRQHMLGAAGIAGLAVFAGKYFCKRYSEKSKVSKTSRPTSDDSDFYDEEDIDLIADEVPAGI